MTKSRITTHVLDTARGKPAVALKAVLEFQTAAREWKEVARGETDTDGRIMDLVAESVPVTPGTYRLTFLTAAYHQSVGVDGFYPTVSVTFEVRDGSAHYHVPLLLSPYGYSTYRGS